MMAHTALAVQLVMLLLPPLTDSFLSRNATLPFEEISAAILVHFRSRIEAMRMLLAPVLRDNTTDDTM
jgi:hypothetical protein